MIEYLEIEQITFVSMDKIKIWVAGDKVHYALDFMRDCTDIKDAVADCTPEHLTDMLERLQIKTWKKHYEPAPDMAFLDGTSWTVKYKERDAKARRFSGENAWPANWDTFLAAIKSVTAKLGDIE